jgi:DNA-binding MarR family transcriptional regulator
LKPENEPLLQDIVAAIRLLVRAVSLDSQEMSRQFGLTGPQSEVLRNLVKKGSLSSADLSRMAYRTPANITGIIDRLEKKGLVERIRKEGDRRVVLIALTEAGLELGKTLPDPIEKRIIAKLGDLEPKHVQILDIAINQILNLIKADGTEDELLDLSRWPDSDANPENPK